MIEKIIAVRDVVEHARHLLFLRFSFGLGVEGDFVPIALSDHGVAFRVFDVGLKRFSAQGISDGQVPTRPKTC